MNSEYQNPHPDPHERFEGIPWKINEIKDFHFPSKHVCKQDITISVLT